MTSQRFMLVEPDLASGNKRRATSSSRDVTWSIFAHATTLVRCLRSVVLSLVSVCSCARRRSARERAIDSSPDRTDLSAS